MTTDTQLPKSGDRVVVVTTSLFRYEGLFDKVNKSRNSVTLSQVRAYGTENREAQTFISGSNKVYGKVEFRADDIKEFALVGDKKPRSLQADPAIVRVENYRGNWKANKLPNLYFPTKMMNPGFRYNPQQHMETYQRGFRQGNMMPWTKQMPQQRGKMAPLGPQSPRFQQLRGSPQQRGGQALWFHKPRRPSEGIFPQKHPGMQSITMEDYDFEKGIEEFKKMSTEKPNSDGDKTDATTDSPVKGENQEKAAPVYDMSNFFDNLKLASEGYDSVKKVADQPVVQQQQIQKTPPRYSRNQLKNHLIETFGEDTVASLYRINDQNEMRERSRSDYRPTVNFHKQYRGFNTSQNRNFPVQYPHRHHPVLTAPLTNPYLMSSRSSFANSSRKGSPFMF